MRRVTILGTLLAICLTSLAALGLALDIKLPPQPGKPVPFDRYAVYYGDFDRDIYQDIYFHGLTAKESPPGFAFFGLSEGGYQPASAWDMTDTALQSCMSCARAMHGSDYIFGDMDGDGFPEILVKGRDVNQSTLLIRGVDDGYFPQILLEILPSGHVRLPGQPVSREPYFRDNLRQSDVQITQGQLWVDGTSHSLGQLRLAASRNQSTASKSISSQSFAGLGDTSSSNVSSQNIPAPPTPSLPAHSLSTAQITEIDSASGVSGEFRVNEMGVATYSVPLALPVGTAGVTPEVSLNYSSQAGVSSMGLGWSLGAGGAISRCRQTLQVDGVALAIQFNEQDRFCLDGQRLLLTSGTNGADGATYKLEIDSGLVVTSYGATTGHPDYFEVKAKDGSVSLYGGSGSNHNSELVGRNPSGTVLSNRTLSWNLSEFKDSVGNQTTYTYEAGVSFFRLLSIAYGYGSSGIADVQVSFQYGTRKKSEIQWVKDSRYEDGSRLNSIQISDKNILVREYRIGYNLTSAGAPNDLLDRVTSVDNCLDGTCVRPLKLSWGFPSPDAASKGNGRVTSYSSNLFNFGTGGFSANGYPTERITAGGRTIPTWSVNALSLLSLSTGQYMHSYQQADINGDGRADLLILRANTSGTKNFTLYTRIQTESGFSGASLVENLAGDPTANGGVQDPRVFPVDFNADSRMDLAIYLPSSNTWRTYFSEPQVDGSWKLIPVSNFLPANMPNNLRFMDVNSDGLTDLVYIQDGVLIARYLKLTGVDSGSRAYSFSPTPDITTNMPSYDGYFFSGMSDLNEDGRSDFFIGGIKTENLGWFLGAYDCKVKIEFLNMTSSGLVTFSQQAMPEGASVWPVWRSNTDNCVEHVEKIKEKVVGPTIRDIDGDGLADMVWTVKLFQDSGDDFYWISYRRGLPNLQFDVAQTITLTSIWGRSFELLDVDSDGDQDLLITVKDDAKWIAHWNGTGFNAPVTHMTAEVGRQTQYSDLDGDGYLDRLTLKDGKLTANRGKPRTNNVVVQFQTGLGAVTSVAYEPLRDSARYRKLQGLQNVPVGTTPGSSHCPPVAGMPCTAIPPQTIYAVNSSEFYQQINNPFAGVDPETDLQLTRGVPAQEPLSTIPVVTRVSSSAPTGANANQLAGVDYSYEGLKIQAGGRGMLGFKKLTTTDMQTGVATTTEYRQDWPFAGSPVRTTTKTHHGQLLTSSTSRMLIRGITTENIESKRTQARAGTANLGPLVLYTAEARDITYSVPDSLLVMPDGTQSTPTLTETKLADVTTTTEVDDWANTTRLQVVTRNGAGGHIQTQLTENTYYPGDGERLGRLKRSVVTTSRPNVATHVRTADFTYYGYDGAPSACSGAFAGLLCSEQVTANDLTNSETPEASLHFYDSRGNKTHTRTGSRTSPFAQYDDKGRFLQATYDLFLGGHLNSDAAPIGYPVPSGVVVIKTSEVLERNKFGNALRARNRVGQNAWVEQVQSATPMGTVFFKGDSSGAFEQTRLQRTTTDTNCPANTALTKITAQAGGAQSTECYDKVGRAIGSYKPSLQGALVRTAQEFDVLGRAVRVYEPTLDTAPNLSTDTKYDVLGRPVLVTHPFFITNALGEPSTTLATTRYSYSGFQTSIQSSGHTGSIDRTRMEVRNPLGELALVMEMGARGVLYYYDASGNLTKTSGPAAGDEIINIYNGLGQKVETRDPDKGTWTYYYDSYGDLVVQADAKDTRISFVPDFKGRRMFELVMPTSGSGLPGFVHVREYDQAANGLGQVGGELKLSNSVVEFQRKVTFDSLGRAITTQTQFSGSNGEIETHHEKVTYDQFGRVYQTFDAARTGEDFTRNGVQNFYNERGYLTKVHEAADAASIYYSITGTDARGNVGGMTYGSGEGVAYEYDPRRGFLTTLSRTGVLGATQYYRAKWDHLGNMVSRQDSLMADHLETFQYDQHNRLTRNTLGGASYTTNYDIRDNITSKSDVGNGATYEYHPTKKHAVVKAGNREFDYDQNGNVIRERATGNATPAKVFTYTGKDLVSKITSNGHSSEFFYGTDNQRYKRIDIDSQNKRTVTLYLGGVEKIYHHDGVVEWKRQIGGIAQVTHRVTNGTPDTGARQYFLKDHLGSITSITNGSGTVLHRMAFNPWGARRAIINNTWLNADMSQSSILAAYSKTAKPTTHRGFTGHEMLDEVGIIHMNGRIYDAYLARFLQADPFIQDPTAVGSLNRYSYVMNNPMNAVDPTGYYSLKRAYKNMMRWNGQWLTHKIVHEINPNLSTVVGVALNFIPVVGTLVSMAWNANHTFFLTGSLTAGVKSFAISYVSGAAFSGIGSAGFGSQFGGGFGAHVARSIAHGMVGGIGAVLQGGKFGHGFASAGLTKFMNVNAMFEKAGMGNVRYDNARIAAAAVIGGTISQATGGKFANGAATAAMGQAFNGNQENKRWQARLGVPPQHEQQVKFLESLATDAASEVDATCELSCKLLPFERGRLIHKRFEHKVKMAGGYYDAEVSYLDGARVYNGTAGSSRADAIYGLNASPEFAIELKTGWFAFISDQQINNYMKNLPEDTQLYMIWVR